VSSSTEPVGVDVVTRRAQAGDAEQLAALSQAVAAEPEGWLLSVGSWRSAGEERRYLRAMKRHPDAAVFVAELEGEIVGRLSLGRDPHPSSRHVADLGLIVAKHARRRGVGTALLEAAVGWAQESGVRKLELHVFPHNEPAIRLYERFGFVEEGLRKGQYRRGHEYVDVILMAFELSNQTR
jgi:RimJ/RimL family protein N-acetyltransferase